MPAGFGVSLWELAWFSLDVLHQQRPTDAQNKRTEFENFIGLWGTDSKSNSGAATTIVSEELLRCSYVIFGDGQHAQFNPSAGSCDAPRSPLLSAGGFLSPCLRLVCVIQRLQLRPGSLCLSAPSHCCRSVPVLLYHPPSSGDWAALVRFDEDSLSSTRQRAPTPHDQNVPARDRRCGPACADIDLCICVRAYESVHTHKCANECVLVWKSESSSGRSGVSSSLLAHSWRLRPPCVDQHRPPPFNAAVLFPHATVRVSDSLAAPLLHQLYRFCIFRAYIKVYGVDSHGGWRQLWHEQGGVVAGYKLWFNKWDLFYLAAGGKFDL